MEEFLNELASLLEFESNEKVTEAMQLFIRCDDFMKKSGASWFRF